MIFSGLEVGGRELERIALLSPPHPPAPAEVNSACADPSGSRKRILRSLLGAAVAVLAVASATAQPLALPPRPSPAVEALVGEYGDGNARLVLREASGALEVSVDGRAFEPVKETGGGRYVATRLGEFRVDRGVPLAKTRNGAAQSVVQGLSIGSVFLPRRDFGGAEGVFRITPLRPVAHLLREARTHSPPVETGDFLPADLVDVRSLDKSILIDARYATAANFLATPVYGRAQVRLQRKAAEAVVRAHRSLKSQGYGLLLHDGYRPWFVTWVFWNATPEASRDFVADPAKGSRHNRACAIDLTLYDLKTRKPVDMPGLYDEMSPRSSPEYAGGTTRQRALRDLLRSAMEREGFSVYETEWWHFDYKDWPRYALSNASWWN